MGGLQTMHLRRLAIIAVISIAIDTHVASAECPAYSVALSEPLSVAIFSGVATETVNLSFSQIVTFKVERVWKRVLGKEVIAYQVVSSESPR